jgi:hypothetical protein
VTARDLSPAEQVIVDRFDAAPDALTCPHRSAGHSVRWWLDRDSVYGEVSCHERPDAICRMACPQGCEAWPCGHELEQVSVCSAVEWFHLDGDVESLFGGGERVPLRDGPINVSWEGDHYLWTYAPQGEGCTDMTPCAGCPNGGEAA